MTARPTPGANDVWGAQLNSWLDEQAAAHAASPTAHSGTYEPVTSVVNVKSHGALGNGVADDRVAIAAAIAALGGTGGTVFCPKGTYMISLGAQGTAGYYAGIVLPANTRLVGAGRGVTTIKLIANQTPDVGVGDGVGIIFNSVLTGGDENIEVSDLTVDGNGANQTKLHNGLMFIRTRGVKVTNVRVTNVRGTSNSPPGETFHFETQLGLDTTFVNCEAVGSAGTQGSGFSADNATNVSWIGCTARGMSAGHGFTAYQCVNPKWEGCNAYLNGDNGFNCEESFAPQFVDCHAGGQAALGTTPYPYAAGTTLGNTSAGFIVLGSAQATLVGCTSRKNATGLGVVEGTGAYGACSGRAIACNFTDNTNSGVSMATAATELRWVFGIDSRYTGNTTTAFNIPQGNQNGPGGNGQCIGAPAVAATGVAVTNPYPFKVVVYIDGGTTTLRRVNGADVGNGATALHLNVGDTITIFYSVVPTWIWFPA